MQRAPQCEHLALCVAAAAKFCSDELLTAAQHRLVLPRLTVHVPRQHLRAWDPEVPDMETPALVTAVHIADAENVGIDMRAGAQAISRLQKFFACATDATMGKHGVLWNGPLSGHPSACAACGSLVQSPPTTVTMLGAVMRASGHLAWRHG